jgi:hypothetical protein
MLSLAGVAAAVVAGVLAMTRTPADPRPKDQIPCKKEQHVCSTSCADSTYTGFGECLDGKNGNPIPNTSIECCCCTEGYEKRYWYGG